MEHGENCTQNSRVLLHKDIHDKLMPKILAEAENWKTGNALDPANRLAPVIEKAYMETVLGYIEKGRAEGAKLVYGGERILEATGGFFIKPGIFDGCDQSMTIIREEIFGPVFAVETFSTIEEAIAMANDTEYGLQTSVHSDNVNDVAVQGHPRRGHLGQPLLRGRRHHPLRRLRAVRLHGPRQVHLGQQTVHRTEIRLH